MSNSFISLINNIFTHLQLSILWILSRNFKISYIDVGASSFQKPIFGRAFGAINSFGFEPDIRSENDFADLKKIGDFKLFPLGLSNIDGDSDLFLTRKSHCSSLMRPYETEDSRYEIVDVISIPCKRLDALDLKADVIKIDVQGAEKKVIIGGLATLKNAVILECELFISKTYIDQTTLTDLLELLTPMGFILLDVCGIYRNFKSLGKIEFTDLVFVNQNSLPKTKKNFYILVAHAIERNYLGRIYLNPNLYDFSLIQKLLLNLIKFINFFKFSSLLTLKG